MKTTTKRTAGKTVAVYVVLFTMGAQTARFELIEGRDTVALEAKEDGRLVESRAISRDEATARMAAMVAGRWTREATEATMPAWAV